MDAAGNKYGYFEILKKKFEDTGLVVGNVKEINCGLQFAVDFMGSKAYIRIYESKKGTHPDFSQVRDEKILKAIMECIGESTKERVSKNTNFDLKHEDADPEELIGTDESGKGDYFGPLVIAGVFGDNAISMKLKDMGVDDSKKLSDSRIGLLAPEIKRMCPFSIITIGNEKYNELYIKIKNLNKMLAWGHARAIENVLGKTECKYVLSDQFGDPSLIEEALLDKGKNIILKQRPRAEENVIVAAASILARHEYVLRMSELEQRYEMHFPKGSPKGVIDTAKSFLNKYGRAELTKVAKLHFKTTESLEKI